VSRICQIKIETYTPIPFSLMIYPMPYPSAATGPNPNRRNAGLLQFEVGKIEGSKVFSLFTVLRERADAITTWV
jgi:hypothetical protein